MGYVVYFMFNIYILSISLYPSIYQYRKTHTMFGDVFQSQEIRGATPNHKPTSSPSPNTPSHAKKTVKSNTNTNSNTNSNGDGNGDGNISDISNHEDNGGGGDGDGDASPLPRSRDKRSVQTDTPASVSGNVPGMFQMTIFEVFAQVRETSKANATVTAHGGRLSNVNHPQSQSHPTAHAVTGHGRGEPPMSENGAERQWW